MNTKLTLSQLRHFGERIFAAAPIKAAHYCCICRSSVRRFLPYRGSWSVMPAVLADAGIVGSDIENFECPVCGCHDRERHLFLYLQASGLLVEMTDKHILHLAPERRLQRLIARSAPRSYVLGDLYPARADIRRVDLMNIDCADESFDFVIANHVLEHVADDTRSLREVLRVLRPGGRAILQTPFASRLSVKFEDPGITTEAARLQSYGQEDHCRLYGADFAEFVASVGFVPQTATHVSLLPAIDSRRMGVNEREPFLLFSKPQHR